MLPVERLLMFDNWKLLCKSDVISTIRDVYINHTKKYVHVCLWVIILHNWIIYNAVLATWDIFSIASNMNNSSLIYLNGKVA